MHTSVLIAALILWSSAATGGQAEDVPHQPSVELPAALARVLTDYELAWSRRDAAALAQLFAEDGFVLPNGHPPVKG